MKILPYATQWITRADIRAVSGALRSAYLTQGPLVEEFERAVAEYCGAHYAVAVNSGTSALHIACLAAGLKKGDEGVTSPITFAASSNCLLYCGSKPVFADIDSETICAGAEEVLSKITPRTKAVIPVHFGGHAFDMDKLRGMRKGICIIEDACHALGAEYKGRKIGSCAYSDMAVLSFHAVKHITTGEGGMVLTNDRKLYERLKLFRSHGITRDPALLTRNPGGWYYEMHELGYNYRITDFQCALGLSQLKKLDAFVAKRRKIAAEYDRAFAGMEELILQNEKPYASSSYHLYPLRFDLSKLSAGREAVFSEYRKRGILVNVHYYPVYLQPYYRKLGYRPGACPKAELYYSQAVTLPLFPKMNAADVAKVIKATKAIVGKFRKR